MKSINPAMKIALLVACISGCAHQNDAVDTSFYDNQWSKPEGTQASWDRDSHECKVEEHQRTSFDELKIKNARDLDDDMYESSRRSGTMYWGGVSPSVQKKARESEKFYWSDCMGARQWQITDRKFLASEDNEKDIESDTNSFKQTK